MLSYVAFVNGWPVLVMYNIRLMTSEEKNWDEDSVDSRAAAGFAPEALLEHGLAPILQRYLAGYSWGRSGLRRRCVRPPPRDAKTVDYDYTAASLALADAGVVEALRHIHDTATIWVRQQHACLTLNAIESARTRRSAGGCAAGGPPRAPSAAAPPLRRAGPRRPRRLARRRRPRARAAAAGPARSWPRRKTMRKEEV